MADTTRVSITVTNDLHSQLSDLAKERGQSMGYIAREAIAQYLARAAGKTVDNVHPELGGSRPGAGRPTEA